MDTVLSSAALLSTEPITLDDVEINAVMNAINDFIGANNFFTTPLMLFPSLNLTRIQMEYENILDQPNMTINLVLARSHYKIYFCNVNNVVYQIITDDFTQRVYQVVHVNPNF
jgi:hypothetical protein